MNLKTSHIILLLILTTSFIKSLAQQSGKNDYLVLFRDTVTDGYGYKNLKGDTIIPVSKYSQCFTDTFRTYAIVLYPYKGFVGIDRQEKILYKVFVFDNGPDDSSDGLFRILVDNKIGYANSLTGKIVIKPQFDCAWPFEHGIAKVSTDCKKRRDGEHTVWLSNSWYYIDKTGRKVHPRKTN
jgi:hypothetical protein